MTRRTKINRDAQDAEPRFMNWATQLLNMCMPWGCWWLAGRGSAKTTQLLAERLKQAIDSLHNLSPDASILIAGDFTDDANSPALQQLYDHGLSNLTHSALGSHGAKGTYKYQGQWESIDHILVSGKIQHTFLDSRIHDAPFLLEDDETYGGKMPKRNYRGYEYRHGYSDHLPLVARFSLSSDIP